jgi:hypothetical protein
MRLLAVAVALCLLPFAAAPVAAEPTGGPFAPVCPLITDLATVCVGGVLQCFVSVRLMGGDRLCLLGA